MLIVLLLLIAAVAYVPVSSYLAGRFAPVDEAVIEQEEETPAAVTEITDEELDKLISGEASLDELLAGGSEQGSGSSAQEGETAGEEAAASADSAAAGTSSTEAASGGKQQSGEAVSSGTASSSSTGGKNGTESAATGGSAVSAASGSSSSETPAYEAEIKALILQLYAVQARAESGLNACIDSARAEYKALPEAQQTQAKKVAICFSKAGQLSALQASCDKEVESIVSQMRQVLTENGQSTALADQAMETYKSQKTARYNELVAKLYS